LFVLQTLSARGELTVNQLAEQALTHQSSVSMVASKLVEKGLVKKHKPEQGDGRCVVLGVTPKGRLLLAKAPPMAQEYLVAAVQKMKSVERTALSVSLGKLVRALEASHLEPRMLFEEHAR
jgi:DNA-binding MarR family transcriptional regulator